MSPHGPAPITDPAPSETRFVATKFNQTLVAASRKAARTRRLSVGSPKGKLASAAGEFDLVAIGSSFVAGTLEPDLATQGVEALLVEG